MMTKLMEDIENQIIAFCFRHSPGKSGTGSTVLCGRTRRQRWPWSGSSSDPLWPGLSPSFIQSFFICWYFWCFIGSPWSSNVTRSPGKIAPNNSQITCCKFMEVLREEKVVGIVGPVELINALRLR